MASRQCKAKTCFGLCMIFVKKPKKYCHVHDPDKAIPRLKQKILAKRVHSRQLLEEARTLEREQLKLEAEQGN